MWQLCVWEFLGESSVGEDCSHAIALGRATDARSDSPLWRDCKRQSWPGTQICWDNLDGDEGHFALCRAERGEKWEGGHASWCMDLPPEARGDREVLSRRVVRAPVKGDGQMTFGWVLKALRGSPQPKPDPSPTPT